MQRALALVLALALGPLLVAASSCPLFTDTRVSSAQPTLSNCTWYATNSCCQPAELDAMLATQTAIVGASTSCIEKFNLLMCWVCSPKQSTFYSNGRLTICPTFCDSIYTACPFSGSTYAYTSAAEFCSAMSYTVSSVNCFSAASRSASAPPLGGVAALAAALVLAPALFARAVRRL